ncbi:hypothetical protein ACGF5F_29665 [Streptomyces sp. NPDC047821]|uniref:hypothetical protein n=1 Tax=Streptomyces sp. NPDC047821 TaxID=3365488 RepID=UPI003721CA56
MADLEYFFVPGLGEYPNLEKATEAAERHAKGSDEEVEIYRVVRTRVRCCQRKVTVAVMDVPAGAVSRDASEA